MSDKGDAENQDINLTLGGDFDRGNAVVNFSYANTSAVRQSDRIDCSKYGTEGTFECFGSSTTEGVVPYLLMAVRFSSTRTRMSQTTATVLGVTIALFIVLTISLI